MNISNFCTQNLSIFALDFILKSKRQRVQLKVKFSRHILQQTGPPSECMVISAIFNTSNHTLDFAAQKNYEFEGVIINQKLWL